MVTGVRASWSRRSDWMHCLTDLDHSNIKQKRREPQASTVEFSKNSSTQNGKLCRRVVRFRDDSMSRSYATQLVNIT